MPGEEGAAWGEDDESGSGDDDDDEGDESGSDERGYGGGRGGVFAHGHGRGSACKQPPDLLLAPLAAQHGGRSAVRPHPLALGGAFGHGGAGGSEREGDESAVEAAVRALADDVLLGAHGLGGLPALVSPGDDPLFGESDGLFHFG